MKTFAMTWTLRRLALEAGAAIMAVRARVDQGVREKADRSPVTEADLAADAIIATGLAAAYPDLPVVTEERAQTHALAGAQPHFLVDPLDGTREFIAGGADFTVNIALVEGGAPTAGVVYAPALGLLARTDHGGGAVRETGIGDDAATTFALRVAQADIAALRVVASRRHRDPETDAYIARFPGAGIVSAGSSLKFCLVAAGEADLYPRFGRTMEWDTAAGHAVLNAAGGHVRRVSDGAPLFYGKHDKANPGFIAHGSGVPAF